MPQVTFNGTKINVEFTESSSRQQLNSGENISTLFGKIKKIFSDLKAVCFSGSYNDLSNKPSSLPANGGTADNISGIIILTGENIKAASVEGAVKWACVDNTTANTDGFVTAGIWFKNNLSYAVTAQIITYANQKTPIVQVGYGTGTFQEMFITGRNREWYSNNTLEITPTPINMVVPAGKTGYFAFNNTQNDVYAVIDDANVFTTVTTRFM